MFALFDESLAQHLFTPDISVLEKIIRPILVYLFLVIALRVFGKRELAQLNPFDLVVLLTLSNTVQNAIIGSDNSLVGGVIGALTLLMANYLVVRFLFKHRRLDQIFEGQPTMLIENGKLDKAEMAKELLTESDLLSAIHKQGFSSINEIETCRLEPGGGFFIKGKEPNTASQRHEDLIARLDKLQKEIEELKKKG
ncbi:MAG: DUF421 domain-containing protein [Pyrinomonadaceae bacterium]